MLNLLTSDNIPRTVTTRKAMMPAKTTRMTAPQRKAAFNRDLAACRAIRSKWRQRDRDAEMLENGRRATHLEAERVIREAEQQRRRALIVWGIRLAQGLEAGHLR